MTRITGEKVNPRHDKIALPTITVTLTKENWNGAINTEKSSTHNVSRRYCTVEIRSCRDLNFARARTTLEHQPTSLDICVNI
jgi:hypothetical protein